MLTRWLGFALVASLAGFFATGCYRYVRHYATIRSLGHVVLAVVVKEALLAVVLLVRLVPSSSAILLLIFSPLIGICAAAVKFEDKGPVLYA